MKETKEKRIKTDKKLQSGSRNTNCILIVTERAKRCILRNNRFHDVHRRFYTTIEVPIPILNSKVFDSTAHEFTWQSSTPANEQLIRPIGCTRDRDAPEVYTPRGVQGVQGRERKGEGESKEKPISVTARARRRWCCALPRLARRVRIIVIYCLAAVFS